MLNTVENQRLAARAAAAATMVAGTLLIAKLAAWGYTGSAAMLAASADSALDMIGSGLIWFAVRVSAAPADDDHRYGHSKAEPLSALSRAAFVFGAAGLVAVEAGRALADPAPLNAPGIAIAVAVFTILATGALVIYQRRVAQRTGSLAILADSIEYRADILASCGVLAALLAATIWPQARWLDPAAAFCIVIYILWNASRLGRRALDQLMDREIGPHAREQAVAAAFETPEVLAVHDVRTRAAGPLTFVQLHIELAADLPLTATHDIADRVEESLHAAFPNADVLVHVDPVGLIEDASGHGRDRVLRAELGARRFKGRRS